MFLKNTPSSGVMILINHTQISSLDALGIRAESSVFRAAGLASDLWVAYRRGWQPIESSLRADPVIDLPQADVERDVLFAPCGAPAQTGKSRGCKSRLTKE